MTVRWTISSLRALCGALALALWLWPAAPSASESEPLRILAFGDSLVHGYGLAADEVFPVQLERALEREGYRVKVLNGGNSGDTTAAGLATLERRGVRAAFIDAVLAARDRATELGRR